MKPGQVTGAVIFAVGIVLLYFAYNASNAPVDQITNAITGRFTSQTMWYLFGGVAAAIGGGLLFLVGQRA
jgi:multisubunit Na+/H+ antiporter MnhB subunit